MRNVTRGLVALAGAAAASLIGVTSASGAPASPGAAATPHTAKLCSAKPAPGYAACMAVRRTDVVAPHSAAAAPSGLGPGDLRSAYKLGAGGSGQTVAIVDAQDDPNAEADLGRYRSTYGLPACTSANGCFRKVNQSGNTASLPTADAGWAGEISLDLDMVSAVCPACHILLVVATSPSIANLGTSVNTAARLGAKYVSNSYGGGESGTENSYDSRYYTHPGVAVTASSGDSGYDGGSYPATGAGVTAVGGTSLRHDGSARGWNESAWNGAGSGCSRDVAKPAFQNGVNTACGNRAEADVSAVADPQTGVAVYDTYQASGWNVYGGTSAAAPIVASVYALAGNPGSAPNADPYGNPGALNDVTSGSNGSCGSPQCTAGTGWDGPTGLGTPNGTAAFGG